MEIRYESEKHVTQIVNTHFTGGWDMSSVLVIDDEAPVRKVLRKALEREGYKVMDAADGLEAIGLYREHPTDLVLTDILMPEKEGLETIMALKRDFPELTIFAMSGGGSLINSNSCLSMAKVLGATRVYTKPLGIEELLKDIGELLNN
jgi:CheY-like chemotaxis protein